MAAVRFVRRVAGVFLVAALGFRRRLAAVACRIAASRVAARLERIDRAAGDDALKPKAWLVNSLDDSGPESVLLSVSLLVVVTLSLASSPLSLLPFSLLVSVSVDVS